jgi:hypothetical protein
MTSSKETTPSKVASFSSGGVMGGILEVIKDDSLSKY